MKKQDHNIKIISNDICLRKLTLEDLIKLDNDCFLNDDYFKYSTYEISKNIASLKNFFYNLTSKYKKKYNYFFAVELIYTKELIGAIFVIENNIKNKTCDIEYVINKKWWDVETISKILLYVINFLFNYTIFETVIFKTHKDNMFLSTFMKKNRLSSYRYNKINDNNIKTNNFHIYKIQKFQILLFNNYNCFSSIYSFDKFYNFYNQLCIKYKPVVNKLNNDMLNLIETTNVDDFSINKYINLNIKRKKILCDVIYECISFFDIITDNKVVVYLNGSYSRCNHRLYSDIDINYSYENKLFSKMLIVEELIAYILTNIFNITYRDRVHPMGYIPLIRNYKINNSNKYMIKFDSGDILINECRISCFDIMYRNLNFDRDINSVIKYLSSNNNINSLNEFCYSYEILYPKSDDKILESIHKDDMNIITNKAFPYYVKLYIKEIKKDISNQIKSLKCNYKYIKEFKKYYKTIPSTIISEIFMLIRRYDMYIEQNIDKSLIKVDFNIFKNFISIDLLKKSKKAYYNYIFEINKIEHAFYISKVSLSSHTNKNMLKVSNNYMKLYSDDISANVFVKLKELYYNLLDILNTIGKGKL